MKLRALVFRGGLIVGLALLAGGFYLTRCQWVPAGYVGVIQMFEANPIKHSSFERGMDSDLDGVLPATIGQQQVPARDDVPRPVGQPAQQRHRRPAQRDQPVVNDGGLAPDFQPVVGHRFGSGLNSS